jgi:hypothetical protein
MKRKTTKKPNHLINNNYAKTFAMLGLLTSAGFMISEPAYAEAPDAFSAVYTKLSGWIGGSAGKVITIIAISIAGLMGALGFSGRHVVGALGVGLLLSMATTVVNMIFG